MKKNIIRRNRSDAIFDKVNVCLLILVMLIILYPIYFTVIASFSDPYETAMGRTYFFIKGFSIEAYRQVFKNGSIWNGYANTILYTAAGTLWSLLITIPCSYGLSRRNIKGRGIIMGIFVFTMFFSGGLIPGYILIKNLGLINSRLAMIIPVGLSMYNMIVARTFFQSNFPQELYESATIDGCSDFGIFAKIALPLSGSIVAVIALFVAVGQWNSYFSALLYLSDSQKWPLQLILRSILIQNQQMAVDLNALKSATIDQTEYMLEKARMAESMKYSLIFISSVPMLIAYPFVQKYFIRGVLIGSIKG